MIVVCKQKKQPSKGKTKAKGISSQKEKEEVVYIDGLICHGLKRNTFYSIKLLPSTIPIQLQHKNKKRNRRKYDKKEAPNHHQHKEKEQRLRKKQLTQKHTHTQFVSFSLSFGVVLSLCVSLLPPPFLFTPPYFAASPTSLLPCLAPPSLGGCLPPCHFLSAHRATK